MKKWIKIKIPFNLEEKIHEDILRFKNINNSLNNEWLNCLKKCNAVLARQVVSSEKD